MPLGSPETFVEPRLLNDDKIFYEIEPIRTFFQQRRQEAMRRSAHAVWQEDLIKKLKADSEYVSINKLSLFSSCWTFQSKYIPIWGYWCMALDIPDAQLYPLFINVLWARYTVDNESSCVIALALLYDAQQSYIKQLVRHSHNSAFKFLISYCRVMTCHQNLHCLKAMISLLVLCRPLRKLYLKMKQCSWISVFESRMCSKVTYTALQSSQAYWYFDHKPNPQIDNYYYLCSRPQHTKAASRR